MDDIELRPATFADRPAIFRALARSPFTDVLLGHPSRDATPLLSFEAFRADYRDHYFDASDPEAGRCFVIEHRGRPVGQVNHNAITPTDRITELDIWMFAPEHCGRGLGTRALDLLCRRLRAERDVRLAFVQPSASNARAIRSYEKAGFRRASPGERARLEEITVPDTPDPLYLTRVLTRPAP